MTQLASDPWHFILWEHDGRLYLDVLCGTVGLYETVLELTPAERAAWESGGIDALRALATQVSSRPSAWRHRHVKLP
jgi:hypothetical protein